MEFFKATQTAVFDPKNQADKFDKNKCVKSQRPATGEGACCLNNQVNYLVLVTYKLMK